MSTGWPIRIGSSWVSLKLQSIQTVLERVDRQEPLTRGHAVAGVDVPVGDEAVDIGADLAVAQVQLGLGQLCLGLLDLGLGGLDVRGLLDGLLDQGVDVAVRAPSCGSRRGTRRGVIVIARQRHAEIRQVERQLAQGGQDARMALVQVGRDLGQVVARLRLLGEFQAGADAVDLLQRLPHPRLGLLVVGSVGHRPVPA